MAVKFCTLAIIVLFSLICSTYSQENDPNCGPNEVRGTGNECCDDCPTDPPTPCTKLCTIDPCVCKLGYKRSPSGTCIPEQACPGGCRKNEERGPYCVCADRCPSSEICADYCVEDGCKCKTGYSRYSDNGACIPTENCPKRNK